MYICTVIPHKIFLLAKLHRLESIRRWDTRALRLCNISDIFATVDVYCILKHLKPLKKNRLGLLSQNLILHNNINTCPAVRSFQSGATVPLTFVNPGGRVPRASQVPHGHGHHSREKRDQGGRQGLYQGQQFIIGFHIYVLCRGKKMFSRIEWPVEKMALSITELRIVQC
jgi:hypothetical protein